MSNNPFKLTPPAPDIKKNAFDMTFTNNMTGKFGVLYPTMCKEVYPGDSVLIDPEMLFHTMPMQFPVQSTMMARTHFFYVRNRNLWKNWEDFIGDTKEVNHPWLRIPDNQKSKRLSVGSLLDYLNVPTSVVTKGDNMNYSSGFMTEEEYNKIGIYGTSVGLKWQFIYTPPTSNYENYVGKPVSYLGSHKTSTGQRQFMMTSTPLRSKLSNTSEITLDGAFTTETLTNTFVYLIINAHEKFSQFPDELSIAALGRMTSSGTPANIPVSTVVAAAKGATSYHPILKDKINELIEQGFGVYIGVSANFDTSKNFAPTQIIITNIQEDNLVDASIISSPFTGNTPAIPLSALPARAYESICNWFYRDETNDPFRINGQIEYNKYIPTEEDGPDDTEYDFHMADWEKDFLTTALPSPQQGIAPLLGARTMKGAQDRFSYIGEDEQEHSFTITSDPRGRVTMVSTYGEVDHKADETTVQQDGPDGDLSILNEMVNFGISINDLRNVAALQVWLEKNMRRGFRYQNQVLSHFGVSIKLDRLNTPEFIGGISQQIQVNTVMNTSSSDDATLGAVGGYGGTYANSSNKIYKYCDEHGFIMAITSFIPIPAYTQLLPKMYLKNGLLDYYFPEFGHIGPQPIDYREVCPLQAYQDGPQALKKVFGYNQPFYDLKQSVDEAHGQYRASMSDFLIHRVFKDAPLLGHDFLSVNPDEVNDVFSETADDDKIYGQIRFKMTMKRPLSLFGEPRLNC